MRKVSALIVLVLIVSLSLTFSVGATSEISNVIDDANIFGYTDIDTIAAEIESMSNEEVTFVVGTTATAYTDREKLAKDFCKTHGLSQEDNIVLLIIDVSDPNETHYDMYTYGEIWDRFTDAEIDRIIFNKDVYNNFKSNNFLSGTLAYLRLANKAYNGHLAKELSEVLTIAIISGVVAALITCIVVVVKYKTKQKSASYPIDKYAKLVLREDHDVFIGSSVTKTRVQSSSSGSRGGRSGGGHRGGA